MKKHCILLKVYITLAQVSHTYLLQSFIFLQFYSLLGPSPLPYPPFPFYGGWNWSPKGFRRHAQGHTAGIGKAGTRAWACPLSPGTFDIHRIFIRNSSTVWSLHCAAAWASDCASNPPVQVCKLYSCPGGLSYRSKQEIEYLECWAWISLAELLDFCRNGSGFILKPCRDTVFS